MTTERMRWRIAFAVARAERFERVTRRQHPYLGRVALPWFDLEAYNPEASTIPAIQLLELADLAVGSGNELRPRPLTFRALEVAGSFRRHVLAGDHNADRGELLTLARIFLGEARDQRARVAC